MRRSSSFIKERTDLNRRHVISMVGTRNATDYGKDLCLRFVRELKERLPDAIIVSGLAYGIDIHAHRAALQYGLDTIGVLAHGLDRIYPFVHRNTASEMTLHGGLLTEFMSGTNPDKQNFVKRNRIVAGISDATIVVESAKKRRFAYYGRDSGKLPPGLFCFSRQGRRCLFGGMQLPD